MVAITGASGLLGANLAAALLEQGVSVRCLRRETSKVDHLAHLDIEWVMGSLSDQASLESAFEGAEAVFHCAARVDIVPKPTEAMIEANVEGTRRVIEACVNQGVNRLIHCSSVVAVGCSDDGAPSDENRPWNLDKYGLDDGYSVTKKESQELVIEAAKSRLDAVIVNPCYMLGPLDARPSSGLFVLEILRGKVPGYSSGVNNFVDVRDVAEGMVQAWRKGRRGECYILGGYNLPYREAMERVAAISGVKKPTRAIPRSIAMFMGRFGDFYQLLTGKEALLSTAKMRWAFCEDYIFTHEKAEKELGYTIRPIDETLRDTIDWFKQMKMI